MSSATVLAPPARAEFAVPKEHQAPVAVTSVPPEGAAEWDRYVNSHPDGTLFHTWGWRRGVEGVFPHEPLYLSASRDGRIVGVLPLFAVRSRFMGRLLVSVPYGVGGGILADDSDAVEALFDAAREIAVRRQCRAIDLRSDRTVVPGLATIDRYVGFRKSLPSTVEEVLASLPRKARAAARNAGTKHGLTVSFGDEHLHDVWRLYASSMRRLASLNYPYAFFTRLIESTPERHWVCVVRRQGRTVAGLVTFLFRGCVLPYFFGSTPEAARCGAANFIYLSVMERGVADGYGVFDFGRTRRDNKGSFDFKRFQGFEPRPLGYQCCVLPGHALPNLSASNPRFRLARRVWRRLPLAVTRTVGARLAGHFPG